MRFLSRGGDSSAPVQGHSRNKSTGVWSWFPLPWKQELQHLSSPGGEGGGSREEQNRGDVPTSARQEEQGGKPGREEAEEIGEGGELCWQGQRDTGPPAAPVSLHGWQSHLKCHLRRSCPHAHLLQSKSHQPGSTSREGWIGIQGHPGGRSGLSLKGGQSLQADTSQGFGVSWSPPFSSSWGCSTSRPSQHHSHKSCGNEAAPKRSRLHRKSHLFLQTY